MSFNGPPKPPIEKPVQNPEVQDEASFQKKLMELIDSGISLQELAQILGAEKYLNLEGTKGKEALHFNVKDFIHEHFHSNAPELRLPEDILSLEDTILPPGEGSITRGSGEGIKDKEIIPRTRAFISILSQLKEPYSLVSGTNTENMVREETYRIFLIPGLSKIAFVNDEEENATFIVHDTESDTWEEYAQLSKDQLKEFSPDKVEVVVYPGSLEEWKIRIQEALLRGAGHERKISVRLPKDFAMESAPDGWKSNKSLSDELGVSERLTRRTAELLREDNPEWFVNYRDTSKAKRIVEFYHPNLIQKIRQQIESRPEKAPEGWYSRGTLSNELEANNSYIAKIADSQRAEHPEWFREYLTKNNLVSEHYHPDLVQRIKEQVRSLSERAPAGWSTNAAIAQELDIAFRTTQKYALPFRETHPEWFKEYPLQNKVMTEHYHPDLIEKIKEIHRMRPEIVPEGWRTTNALAKEMEVDFKAVSRIAERFRTEHAEWFKEYLDAGGRTNEFYSPELVELVKQELSLKKSLP